MKYRMLLAKALTACVLGAYLMLTAPPNALARVPMSCAGHCEIVCPDPEVLASHCAAIAPECSGPECVAGGAGTLCEGFYFQVDCGEDPQRPPPAH